MASPLPLTASQWRDRAIAERKEQHMVEAGEAIGKAAALAPDDPGIAFLKAQLFYELGHPAIALFERARRLLPDNMDLVRNHALACASEGQAQEADYILTEALSTKPDWLEGHRVLTAQRWTQGRTDDFDASYANACSGPDASLGLWLGWFSAHAQVKDWGRAVAVLDKAEKALGPIRALQIARAFVAAESHDDDRAARLFAAMDGVSDDVLDIARIRFLLRNGQPKAAEAVALPLLTRPIAGQVWPYLSLIWRLTDDPRARWLDGEPAYVAFLDVGLSRAELADLAALLRMLHTAQKPYADQSVRGGTQTDRSILLRHEPILQDLRTRLLKTAQTFIASLPPPNPRHPLLGQPRDRPMLSGSWSVRLTGGGHNVTHSHPMGWISSAFYVALPTLEAMGPEPAGWLTLGAPPPELGLDLPPYARFRPEPGKLALFPSTLWHGTEPFAAGERLNVAFDLVPS